MPNFMTMLDGSEPESPEEMALVQLRKATWIWLVAALALLLSFYLILEIQVKGLQNLRWIWLPLSGTLVLWRFLRGRLFDNRRERDGRLLSGLGLGNHLSIFRGVELALLAGFLLIPQPVGWRAWLPALLYTSADILDYLDGYAARVRDEATRLGEDLDQLLDGVGLLIATAIAIRYGALTWFFLPFGAARYLFLAGIWVRERQGLVVHPLGESRSRRPIAGLTMGFMSAMLWPIVKPPASIVAGLVFMLPFAASFLRDWFVISGVIDQQSPGYLRLRHRVEQAFSQFAPIAVRLVLAGLLAWDGGLKLWGQDSHVTILAGASFPISGWVITLFGLIELLAIPPLILGVAGRFTAFMLVFPIGITIMAAGFSDMRALLLVADLFILILGTGRYSLWKPSEALFGRRAGEAR